MSKKAKQFSREFKHDAVQHYLSSNKTIEEAAKDLRIGKSTLYKWVKEAEENNGTVVHRGSGNYRSDDQKEIARLKKVWICPKPL